MDDEFKLCWKNFQDNIASGFQNLYDRGDLVDVTLACDGKLLHAHKIVLAICSPYFQEIFITNPCKHPIIILKDVTFNIMCELLEFMYQGVVNVKHTELQSFMKIGQLLQIKGLATNSSSSAASTSSEKSTSQAQNADDGSNANAENSSSANKNSASELGGNAENTESSKPPNPSSSSATRSHSPAASPAPAAYSSASSQSNFKCAADGNVLLHHPYHPGPSMKRHAEFSSDALSIYSKKQLRRSATSTEHSSEHNDNSENNMEQVADDFFLSSIPHISMVESRYDLNSVKRENDHHGPGSSSASLRNSFASPFNFDYNLYKNNNGPSTSTEYPNELHMPNDYSKSFGNHMDIPPNSSNVVMLSSTSLLHGNCVFNRNNTVATQQGMKTYWLCKSYRISMCRARCITHQGRVISATGVHNHPPHMRNGPSNSGFGNEAQQPGNHPSTAPVSNASAGNTSAPLPCTSSSMNPANSLSNLRITQVGASNMYQHNLHQPQQQQQQQHQHLQSPTPPPVGNAMATPHTHAHQNPQPLPNLLVQHHPVLPPNSQSNLHQHTMVSGPQSSQSLLLQNPNSVIQNMMHMMPPMMSVNNANQHQLHMGGGDHAHPQHHHQHHHAVGSNLEITPLMQSSPVHMQSPSNHSNQSHRGGNTIGSPLPPSGSSMKSPAQGNLNEDACSSTPHMGSDQQQHVMAHNTALSPAEMNANTVASQEGSASGQSDVADDPRHQAHVIDSITISPGNGHNFKIEDM